MIAIDKLTIAANAPHGTVIGHLIAWANGARVVPVFTLDPDDQRFFAITSKQAIMSAWTGSVPPGVYSVHVTAADSAVSYTEDAWFQITVTPAVAPAKTLVLTATPSSISNLPDTTPAGAVLSQLAVQYSDGSAFTGTITSSMPDVFAVNGMQLETARALTSADDGTDSVVITATDGQGLTASVRVL